jgi:hypothetical protein
MLDEYESYRVEQYHGHAPVYGLMLNDDNTTRTRLTEVDVGEKAAEVKLSALARWCYTVMKSFGPTFKASRRAVACRMGIEDLDTVSKLQNELELFELLRSEPSEIGEPRKWVILEPSGRKVPNTNPTGKTRGVPTGKTSTPPQPPRVESVGSPVSSPHPTGLTGTEAVKKALNESVKIPTEKITYKKPLGKWEITALLAGYYEPFDPRHPGFSDQRDNTQAKKDWEAVNGSWLPKTKHPEDKR